MMGFVAAASVSLFVIGTSTITSSQNAAEDAQIENTFKEFNKDVSSVAYGRDKYRTMTFEVQDNKAAFRQEDTGTIKVFVDGTEEVNKSVGALVYERDDSTIAYQAGGVWSGSGNDSRMVAEPPVEYQNGSLTFPIAALQGDENLRAGGLDIRKKETVSPINDDGYIKGKLVRLEITSEYYMGWAEYFRTQTNDVAVSVNHTPPGPKGTVVVKLGKPVANGNFQNGVLATGGDDGDIETDNGNAGISGPVAATGTVTDNTGNIDDPNPEENVESELYELDDAIERKVSDAETNGSIENKQISAGDTLENGETYYDDDGFSLSGGQVTVDLSSGDVTLIVDGDMTLDGGNIKVKDHGTNNVFRVYSTGDLSMKNSKAGDIDDTDARHFQIYGTSTMLVGISGGSTEFVGTIYAPRDEAALNDTESNPAMLSGGGGPGAGGGGNDCKGFDVCIVKGNSAVTGAIVGGPTRVAQSAQLDYDSNLAGIEPTLQLDDGVLPPKITFIKVSVHKVEVNNSDQNSVEPVGGFDAAAGVVSPSGSVGGRPRSAPESVPTPGPRDPPGNLSPHRSAFLRRLRRPQ